MILPINTYSDPVLTATAKPLKGVDSSVGELIAEMFETMHKAPGIGLAAPQVGHSIRLLVVDISTIREYADVKPMVVINPRVVSVSGRNSMEEGCLSVPGVAGDVVRPSRITLHYRDEKFEEHTEEFSDMMARVLQHEIDHLDGTLFVDRMEKRDRRKVQRALDAIRQGRVKTSYPIAPHVAKVAAEV